MSSDLYHIHPSLIKDLGEDGLIVKVKRDYEAASEYARFVEGIYVKPEDVAGIVDAALDGYGRSRWGPTMSSDLYQWATNDPYDDDSLRDSLIEAGVLVKVEPNFRAMRTALLDDEGEWGNYSYWHPDDQLRAAFNAAVEVVRMGKSRYPMTNVRGTYLANRVDDE